MYCNVLVEGEVGKKEGRVEGRVESRRSGGGDVCGVPNFAFRTGNEEMGGSRR